MAGSALRRLMAEYKRKLSGKMFAYYNSNVMKLTTGLQSILKFTHL